MRQLAADAGMQLVELPGGLGGLRASAKEHGVDDTKGRMETTDGIMQQGGMLSQGCSHPGMSQLQQRRATGAEEDSGLPVHPPGDRAGSEEPMPGVTREFLEGGKKGLAVCLRHIVRWRHSLLDAKTVASNGTAGPSTTLRSGRDVNSSVPEKASRENPSQRNKIIIPTGAKRSGGTWIPCLVVTQCLQRLNSTTPLCVSTASRVMPRRAGLINPSNSSTPAHRFWTTNAGCSRSSV